MPMLDEIDFNELYKLLLDAARRAFRFAQDSHPDETFYAFALYHHDWTGYMAPTCNTEEALVRAYQNSGIDPTTDVLGAWSPCDWEYHLLGEQFFDQVDDWFRDFNEVRWEVNRQFLDPSRERREEHAAMFNELHSYCQNWMITIARRVLKTLDEEKLFGVGEVREKIVLNILQGDQGMDWLDHARYLNPPSVHEKWCAAIEAEYEAIRKKYSQRF